MREFTEQELVRREKAQKIKDLGLDPFGHKFERTALASEIKEKYAFKVNVDNAVSVCFSTYRQKMTTDMNLFPYVPAEIESIVREFYQSYYMFDLNFDLQKDANLKQYISSNTPLQISMSAGIKEMDGATKSFAKL